MVNCPECGELLVKGSRRKRYYCENEHCSVIYVQSPYIPKRSRVIYSSLPIGENIEKDEIQKTTPCARHWIEARLKSDISG